jgi:Pectobacterium phage endonuclease
MPKQDTIAIFWSHVVRSDTSDCWLWGGLSNHSGYGMFFTLQSRHIHLRDQLAHRFSFRLHVGDIPVGMCVCHRCDNPPCVNPAHLFLGTKADNASDMTAKNRQARGERITRAKLTTEQVIEIRSRYVRGVVTITTLAREYGVSHENIGQVIRRQTWKHV